jgi:hypothetical protein
MTAAFGRRPETKWKMQWGGKIVGDSESVTVGQAILVGKLVGRDSWIDCMPYTGPEACTAWLVILTAPAEDEMNERAMLEHLKACTTMKLDDLFDTLILE